MNDSFQSENGSTNYIPIKDITCRFFVSGAPEGWLDNLGLNDGVNPILLSSMLERGRQETKSELVAYACMPQGHRTDNCSTCDYKNLRKKK